MGFGGEEGSEEVVGVLFPSASFSSIFTSWVLGFLDLGLGFGGEEGSEEVDGVFLRRVGFGGVFVSALMEALGGFGFWKL